MIPAKEVGGDLYDFFLIDKYRLGVVIADVSGKGIAAALLMAVCKTLLKATAYKGMPADNILSEVNNILVDESPSNMFVTVFYGVLDTRSGAFEYSNGGHNSPYLLSNDGLVKQIPDVGGLLIGAMKDVEYQSNVIMINPGESLIFYTDGVTEAFNKHNEEYREARLENVLKNKQTISAAELVTKVFEDVQNFTNGVEQSDDITCLALKYLAK
jgi:sigma-B regulation protein RsbU (phosphoserine phosphatase)